MFDPADDAPESSPTPPQHRGEADAARLRDADSPIDGESITPEREPQPAGLAGFPEAQVSHEPTGVGDVAGVLANAPPYAGTAAEGAVSSSDLHWLHPTSLIFEILSHGKTYILPAVIAMASAAQGSNFGLFIAAIIFVPALLRSIILYFTLRYRIQSGELIVTQGLIFTRIRTVPVGRIQNVDLIQNVLHRMFNVAEVRVETASGTEPEATLRVLSMHQVRALRREIRESQASLAAEGDTGEAVTQGVLSAVPAVADRVTVLTIPTQSLLQAGLASNRGMVLFGILVGAFYQFDLEERFDFNGLRNMVPIPWNSPLVVVLLSVVAFLAVLVVLRLVGILWYLLRFHGYRLERQAGDLRISCGLLTKVSATVPRKRIQFVSVHRTLFMRWMGLASIRVETAGGSGKQSENAASTVSRRWFIPVVSETRIPDLLAELRPGLQWDEDRLDWRPLAPRAGVRLVRLAVIQSVLVMLIGLVASLWWGWAFGLVLLPALVAWARKRSQAMRYARTSFGVVYRSGVFTRKTSMTFYEKMQALRIQQSPFDRRWKMATLSVDTAAAGPADHVIQIPLLDAQFAHVEYDELRRQASSHQPVYG